ncbi:MAG: type II secretion system minor pseudopilin GspH [Desulfurivibrionaceae bacterium]|nr:type II secretion system minor pseudopilin GspH [Desulfobulbales bacterium]MDT8334068.1 type II secretion system minor pseudopilin GspH [Desulfurivibrionaceae bacterium]
MIISGRPRSTATAGFSLLEILVVLVIIAILISFAAVTFDSEQEKLAEEGNRLAALMKLAAEEAIMNSREHRVVFTSDGYLFEKLVDGEWRGFEEGLYRRRVLPEDFSFHMTLANREIALDAGDGEAGNRTAVLFLSSGEVTPFELLIRGVSGLEITVGNRSGVIEVDHGR